MATRIVSVEQQYRSLLDGDGLTFSPTSPTPTSGFMVSLAGSERTFPVSRFTANELSEYVRDYAYRAAEESLFYGAWIDGGLVYLDLSVNVQDRSQAIALGRLESQLAIFDVANSEVISL
ncbi:hypothetical protein ACMA1D_18180 [Streptomyces sp. 796.1]|uniref:hypothetical protein n=1 Tax=Streptomyces sp. 796.1 TaxID=3163029 RepID=UPI0039C948AB